MRTIACATALLLCGCGDERPPAPTAAEADQLNEAEQMLNDVGANEEGPEDRSPGPSH